MMTQVVSVTTRSARKHFICCISCVNLTKTLSGLALASDKTKSIAISLDIIQCDISIRVFDQNFPYYTCRIMNYLLVFVVTLTKL